MSDIHGTRDELVAMISAQRAENERQRAGLEAAIRAANLALFVIRKQGVMPNSSWQAGFEKDMATANAAYQQSQNKERMMDKHGRPLKFGDHVHYFIPGHEGHGGYAYVAGEMNYSENGSHVLLVDEKYDGMPIHAGHCTLQSNGHENLVQPWRDRYLKRFPGALR